MMRPEGHAARFADRASVRWGAAVAAALVVTALPPEAFSQPQAAATLSEDENVVLLESDTLSQDDEANTVTAEGDVQVRYQGRTLRADQVVYYLDTRQILARGHVQLVEANGTITYADEMQVDEAFGLGIATNLRARFADDGALAARTAVRRSETRNELSRVIYTSCPVCDEGERPPTWQLKARRAIQDRDSRIISYRGATLEVMGAPILYLPWFAHPDPSSGPRSGLLTPSFGSNRRVGGYFEQPYYWHISPYSDLTASMRLHSNVNPLVGIDYRKKFWSGEMSLDTSFTYEQDFTFDGQPFGDETFRGHVFGQGEFRVNNYWDWGFGLERASDDLYLRRYGIGGAGERRGPYIGDNARLISQLFAIGQNEDSFAQVSFITFQGLRATDSSALTPLILPIADYERVFDALGGQLRWRSNAAILERDTGDNSARVSSGLGWRRDLIVGPGFVVSPFAETRLDAFHVDTLANPDETFTRGGALAGAEISWPLMRPGENVDLLVEPVVMAAYGTPGGDDPRIANEDSLGFELDDSNLFRPSGTPNFDLWDPGGRVAAGVRASARARNGRNASLLFGRRWRDIDSPIFTPQNNQEDKDSDYVAAASVDLGRPFGAIVRTRLDDRNFDVQRIDAEVRGALWRLSAYGRYFSVDDSLAAGNPSRELTTSIGLQLVRGWRVQFGLRRDLDSDTNISQELRAIYEDDCTFLELAYTRSETVDRQFVPNPASQTNEGFQIRVGLRTLGAIGGSGRR